MADKVEQAIQTMIQNLKEKTGKSLEEWVRIASTSKLAKHSEVIKFLKTEYGLGHGYANLIAHSLKAESAEGKAAADDPVAAQYSGEKAGLRPLYDALLKAVGKFGSDVEVSPKKTYVSLRRKKQFAMLGPATKAEVELGLNVKALPASPRLKALPPGGMCQYAVRLSGPGDIDAELMGWVRAAFDAAA